MLRTIIAKEIRANILSFRFLVSFALLFVIVTVTSLVLTGDYLRRQDEYSQRQAELETYLKNYAHFNRIGNILQPAQPPIPSQALVRGLTAEVNLDQFDDDPLPVIFPLIDLTFIVTILVSLMALILSYDAVCGEKEDGTLKLMLANGLSRSKIILGKFAGGLIVTGAALYIAVFYLIGILISSVHRSSSSSIMTSLFVWVLLVLVVPNMSPYLASFLSPTPSRIKVAREIDRMSDVERDDLGRKLAEESRREILKQYPILAERLSEAEVKKRVAEDPGYRNAYEAARAANQKAWDEANRIQSAKTEVLRKDLGQKEEAQTGLARSISMASPMADFTYLATELSSTGMQNRLHVGQLARVWNRLFYGEYQPKKMAELKAKDPTADLWNTAVDMTDSPRFLYTAEGLEGRIGAALGAFAVLAVYVVALFAAAYIAFIRYDAR
ncbi:MAG: ABC transporter permease subunit [Candidatus Aminicenantes bacterium]|nr:ABC transporter permease subunit [Candidatus Aminicenantes bacterium]